MQAVSVTTLRDASRPVDLAGSMASGRQSDIGANAFVFLEDFGIGRIRDRLAKRFARFQEAI
jgi:hypothetical protein